MAARVAEGRGLLTKLPTELLFNIYDELEPSDHFALATTCKLIYARSKPILEIHRNAHRDNRVISDCSLELLVRVYRSAQASVGPKAIEAWHVRKFEIWGSRETWDEWKSWEIGANGTVSLAAHEEPLPSPFSPREVADHIKEMKLKVRPYGDYTLIEDAFEGGEDGYFKATIISMLPRLNDLVFVSVNDHVHKGMLTLTWLEIMIQWNSQDIFPWPPGFKSLRKVSVGVPIFDHPEIEAVSDSISLCTLLHLPSIEEIYYRNVSRGEPAYGDELIPIKTSNVRTLVLDRMRNASLSFRRSLVHASMGLDTLVIRGQSGEQPTSVNTFLEDLKSSVSRRYLRQFLLYQPDQMFGNFCRNYRTNELSSMQNMRMIQLCVEDVLMDCFCSLNEVS